MRAGSARFLLRFIDAHRNDIFVKQIADNIDFMGRRIVNRHLQGVALRHGGVAMGAVDEQYFPQFTAIQSGF